MWRIELGTRSGKYRKTTSEALKMRDKDGLRGAVGQQDQVSGKMAAGRSAE